MENAITKDPKLEPEMVALIAKTWMGSKKYTKAISAFERKMDVAIERRVAELNALAC